MAKKTPDQKGRRKSQQITRKLLRGNAIEPAELKPPKKAAKPPASKRKRGKPVVHSVHVVGKPPLLLITGEQFSSSSTPKVWIGGEEVEPLDSSTESVIEVPLPSSLRPGSYRLEIQAKSGRAEFSFTLLPY